MHSIGRFHGLVSPSMPIDDGCREVFVGDDLGGQPMAHDLHQVAAGEKFGRIAMGYALLGQFYFVRFVFTFP